MIIDIHTHAFPDKIAQAALRKMQGQCHTALFSDGTGKGLAESGKRAGTDLAVIQPVATNPEKVPHLNDWAIRLNQEARAEGLISFGAMHPACAAWEEELERLKAADVPGVKLHPPYAGIDIDDPRSIRILRKCGELGLAVLIHSGLDIGIPGSLAAVPEKIRRALDRTGPLRIIAAHMGGWKRWKEAGRLLPETGAYLDTYFSLGFLTPAEDGHPWRGDELRMLTEEEFCELAGRFGADRVLFGTDSPWADPGAEIRKIRNLPLKDGEKDLILGGNAAKLLRLQAR